jgi:hypothetical protein
MTGKGGDDSRVFKQHGPFAKKEKGVKGHRGNKEDPLSHFVSERPVASLRRGGLP